MIQLFEFEVGDLNVSCFLNRHEYVDEPITDDLDLGLAGHSAPCCVRRARAAGRTPVMAVGSAPAVIFTLQNKSKQIIPEVNVFVTFIAMYTNRSLGMYRKY